MLILSGAAKSESLLSDESEEILFFFSYHCSACYETNAVISAWDLASEHRVIKIPVFDTQQWKFGARLYFLLEQSKEHYPLSKFERERAAYAIVSSREEPQSAAGYARLLREYGMVFTNVQFSQWWRVSGVMMSSTEEILSTLKTDTSQVPFLRVSTVEKVLFIPNQPAVQLLTAVNRALEP